MEKSRIAGEERWREFSWCLQDGQEVRVQGAKIATTNLGRYYFVR